MTTNTTPTRPSLRVMVGVVSVALLFSSCGSGNGPSSGAADVSTQPSTPQSAVRDEPADPSNGRAGFTVEGTTATMSGVIGDGFDDDIAKLLAAHPDLDRIVLTTAPGSEDDTTNLRASRLVYKAGLDTELLPSSEIASGAVDFFLAGRSRTVPDGARIGVHSWGGDPNDTPAADLDRADPAHQPYLKYYAEIGVDPGFYWYTLEAAAAGDIHWMTPAEVEQFNVDNQ